MVVVIFLRACGEITLFCLTLFIADHRNFFNKKDCGNDEREEGSLLSNLCRPLVRYHKRSSRADGVSALRRAVFRGAIQLFPGMQICLRIMQKIMA